MTCRGHVRAATWPAPQGGSSPTTGTKKERILFGFSPFWWPACGWRISAALNYMGGSYQPPPKLFPEDYLGTAIRDYP